MFSKNYVIATYIFLATLKIMSCESPRILVSNKSGKKLQVSVTFTHIASNIEAQKKEMLRGERHCFLQNNVRLNKTNYTLCTLEVASSEIKQSAFRNILSAENNKIFIITADANTLEIM